MNNYKIKLVLICLILQWNSSFAFWMIILIFRAFCKKSEYVVFQQMNWNNIDCLNIKKWATSVQYDMIPEIILQSQFHTKK